MEQTGIETLAEQHGCRISRDAPMSAATTFHIGGTADCLIDLPDETAAQAVLAACHRAGVTPFFLGNGSDLLVGDRGIRGVVLRWDGKRQEPRQLPDGTVVCPAGVSLQRLCRFAQQRGLTGLEFAYGIPGSVGGALFMNAGAYGGEMAQVVLGATALADPHRRAAGLYTGGAAARLSAQRFCGAADGAAGADRRRAVPADSGKPGRDRRPHEGSDGPAAGKAALGISQRRELF